MSALADSGGLDFGRVSVWLNDPGNWWGQNGLLVHLREHIYYTLIAVIVALVIALPLIMSGIRSATLQVIATATVAAYAPFLGGLGRLILDGKDVINDPHSGYPAMVSAGILVAVLAVVADLVLIALERVIVSPGVSGRVARRRGRPTAIPAGGAVVELAKA